MSGSLRVNGDWLATSAAGGWIAGQTVCSLSFFVRFNATQAGSTGIISSPGNAPLLTYVNNTNFLELRAIGSGNTLDAQVHYTPGTVYFIALSWDSSGSQIWYVNTAGVAGITDGGTTSSADGHITIGPPATFGTVDYNVSDPAMWIGYALTQSDVEALATRASTPATLSHPASVWYPLTGTPGNVPNPLSDAGFASLIGGANQFTAVSGSAAIYSADTLVYVSPQTVTDVHTGMDGSTIFTIALSGTASVATVPQFTVNGSPVTMSPPSGGANLSTAFWCWSIPSAVQPTDVLHMTAPANWSGDSPAVNMAVTNNTGKVEFPIPGFPATGSTARTTMRSGMNMAIGDLGCGTPWSLRKNWVWRLQGSTFTWSGTSTIPNNFICVNGAPGQGGLWTLTWDSTDPNTDLSIVTTYTAPTFSPWTATLVSSSPGVGGVGITRVYSVTQSGSVDAGPLLALVISHPTQSPTYTKLELIGPNNTSERDNPYAMEDRVLSKLRPSGITRSRPIIRTLGCTTDDGGHSNAASASDLLLANQGGRIINANVIRVRPLDRAVSPNIIAPDGNLAIPSNYLDCFHGAYYVAEMVCDASHGLKTGQSFSGNNVIPGGPYSCAVLGLPAMTAGGGHAVPAGGGSWIVFVTSPTTFLWQGTVPDLTSGPAVDIDTTYDLSGSPATAWCWLYPFTPYEFFIDGANKLGADLWVNIPPALDDAGVTALAAKIFSGLDPGLRCVFEWSNETWDFGLNFYGQNYFSSIMGQLLGLINYFHPDEYTAHRAGQCFTLVRAAAVAAGRPSTDAVCALMTQWSSAGRGALGFAGAHGIKADVVGVAPYMPDVDNGWSPGWNQAQTSSLYRHYLWYDPVSLGYFADFAASRASYEAAIGQSVKAYAYEGGTETKMGLDVWDWPYSPSAYWDELVLWTVAQEKGGFDEFTQFDFQQQPYNGQEWGTYQDQSQLPGPGLSNTLNGGLVVGNESPRGKAWQDWQANWVAANSSGSGSQTRRWFNGLRRHR